MKCQECDQPATLHITEARQMAAVGERHLCEPHARQYLEGHQAPNEPPAARVGEVPFEVARLIINEVHDQQVVVLQEAGGLRSFSVVIGIFEVTALDRRLKGLSSPRPLTHDAWADTVGALGGRVRDVLIHELRDGVYYVWLRIVQGGRVVAVDVRFSDGLVLAVKLRVPVLVAGRLLGQV